MTNRMRHVAVVRIEKRWQHLAARAAHARGWALHRIALTFGIPRKRLAVVLASEGGWLAAAARAVGISVPSVAREWDARQVPAPHASVMEAAE